MVETYQLNVSGSCSELPNSLLALSRIRLPEKAKSRSKGDRWTRIRKSILRLH